MGLQHSNERSALMYPYYSGYVSIDDFDLDRDDILGIRSIYGNQNNEYKLKYFFDLLTRIIL